MKLSEMGTTSGLTGEVLTKGGKKRQAAKRTAVEGDSKKEKGVLKLLGMVTAFNLNAHGELSLAKRLLNFKRERRSWQLGGSWGGRETKKPLVETSLHRWTMASLL